jgi:hypothetical protein
MNKITNERYSNITSSHKSSKFCMFVTSHPRSWYTFPSPPTDIWKVPSFSPELQAQQDWSCVRNGNEWGRMLKLSYSSLLSSIESGLLAQLH